MGDIAYQNKDIISKAMADTLMGKSLGVFGLPHLKVVDILPTNLPVIESNELRLDNLFVLDDGSIALIDYESIFKKENFVKYLNYIARVIKRYAGNKQLDLLIRIKMIVIYTADVERAEEVYDLGGLRLVIEPAYLVKFDTNQVYQRLNEKILRQEKLSEEELMELMILPLTVKGKQEKQKLIVETVNMARKLEDGSQTVRTLAGILTFTDKIIDKEFKEKVKEEMRMTQIAQMFIEEGRLEGQQEGRREGRLEGQQEGRRKGQQEAKVKIVKTMLLKNKTVDEIHQDTDIAVAFIKKVKKSLEK